MSWLWKHEKKDGRSWCHRERSSGSAPPLSRIRDPVLISWKTRENERKHGRRGRGIRGVQRGANRAASSRSFPRSASLCSPFFFASSAIEILQERVNSGPEQIARRESHINEQGSPCGSLDGLRVCARALNITAPLTITPATEWACSRHMAEQKSAWSSQKEREGALFA